MSPFKLPNLLSNSVNLVAVNKPLFVPLALGKLNVCVLPVLLIAKSVPLVPTAKVWVATVKPFKLPNLVSNSEYLAAVNKPLLVALALGILNLISVAEGVLMLKSVPLVLVVAVKIPVKPFKLATPAPLAVIVIPPLELVMLIPEPAVRFARVKPVPLPINNCPLLAVVTPVPPCDDDNTPPKLVRLIEAKLRANVMSVGFWVIVNPALELLIVLDV